MIKSWMVAACLLVLTAACGDQLEDRLEGKWQLQQVEQEGVIQTVDTIYYNFQTSLFMYQIYNPTTKTFRKSYGFKTLEGDDKLLLELTNNPQIVTQFLPYTDWTSARRTFMIEKSTGSRLILSSDGKRYTFHKF